MIVAFVMMVIHPACLLSGMPGGDDSDSPDNGVRYVRFLLTQQETSVSYDDYDAESAQFLLLF